MRTYGRARALLTSCLLLAGLSSSAFAQDSRSHRARKKRRTQTTEERRQPTVSPGTWETEEDEAEEAPPPPPPRPSNDGDEEVISDPELRNAPPTPTSQRTDEGDEVFSNPELAGGRATSAADAADNDWGDKPKASESSASGGSDYDPLANTGVARMVAFGQFGADIHHEGDLEDAYETRLRFDTEVEFRRSKKVRLSIGVRTDLLWAMPASGDPDLKAAKNPQLSGDSTAWKESRFELDVLPTSAYVDVTAANGFHVRVGEQPVSMARMDFYSSIDMLAAFDMRGQIGLGQSTGKLAQPAVRVDWDLSTWATLEVIYLPWFMPNLVRPNRDRFVADELGTSSATLPHAINNLVAPGMQTMANGESFRFVAPQPDFTNPQIEGRLNMRGHGFEIAVSGGTALEKLPSIYYTPQFERYLTDPSVSAGNSGTVFKNVFANNLAEFDAEYHRYESIALDGSFDLAPLTASFEASFSPSRHLIAATAQATHLPLPNVQPQITDNGQLLDAKGNPLPSNVTDKKIRKGVPVLQGAVHLDYLKGETFAIAAEAFAIQALKLPYDNTRDWWGFIPGKALYAGGIFGGTYRPNPNDGRWRFDASAVVLVGPSVILMPQVEYKMHETFYVNVGAQFFEGPTPMATDPKDGKRKVLKGGPQSLNVGGLFNGYDQVYVGFRYVP